MAERVFTQTFAAAGAIIEKDCKILLVQESLPPDDNKWSHPAGWIDVGEDPLAAVKREVKEETGFDFTPTFLLGIYSLVRKDLTEFWGATPHPIKLIFCGTIGSQSEFKPTDTQDVKWFLPEEIYAMDNAALRDKDIKQMVKDYFAGKRFPLDIIYHCEQRSQG